MSDTKCRILCIDDHHDSAEMLRLLLSHEDYDVVIATSIAEALELTRTESFDLYVLDRRLPDGTGIELCQKLAQVAPGVPCIFYTGDAYELHRQQAMAAGAHGYVAKPHVEALIEAVGKLLADNECTTAS
ncbi:MAG: sensor hybrid histidine kinase [Acidobacteria bacterium]|nr:sensor hybrid histidine kinase [Acidobacteriota bacterium]